MHHRWAINLSIYLFTHPSLWCVAFHEMVRLIHCLFDIRCSDFRQAPRDSTRWERNIPDCIDRRQWWICEKHYENKWLEITSIIKHTEIIINLELMYTKMLWYIIIMQFVKYFFNAFTQGIFWPKDIFI